MSDDRPAAFQDQEFTLEEGWAYRLLRTGAIWSNKLFFSSLFLLAVWLVVGAATGEAGCAESPNLVQRENQTVDEGTRETCSVFLSTTSVYLGAMSLFSFIASIVFGLLGLVVGKQVVHATRTAEEPGAEEQARGTTGPHAPGDAGDAGGPGGAGGAHDAAHGEDDGTP